MAQSIQIIQAPGYTITIDVFPEGTNTVAAVNVAATAVSGKPGWYSAALAPSLVAGKYDLVIKSGAFVLGSDQVDLKADGISQSVGIIGGGSAGPTIPVNVLPLATHLKSRVNETKIEVFIDETLTVTASVVDDAGNPVTLTQGTLRFTVEDRRKQNLLTLSGSEVTVGGVSSNQFTVTLPASIAQHTGRELCWALRVDPTKEVKAIGPIEVKYAAR